MATNRQLRIKFLPIIGPLASGTTNALRGCFIMVDDMAYIVYFVYLAQTVFQAMKACGEP